MKIVVTGILIWLVLSCSMSPTASAIYQATFDFSNVERYGLYDRNADFNDNHHMTDALRNTIELAIEQAADKQGFVYSGIEDADLLITYYVIDKNQASLSAYNQQVLYCDYCLRAKNWASDHKNWSLKPDNIILDLVDPKSKRSVWRSVHPLHSNVQDSNRKTQGKIQTIISAMLAQYPTPVL